MEKKDITVLRSPGFMVYGLGQGAEILLTTHEGHRYSIPVGQSDVQSLIAQLQKPHEPLPNELEDRSYLQH